MSSRSVLSVVASLMAVGCAVAQTPVAAPADLMERLTQAPALAAQTYETPVRSNRPGLTWTVPNPDGQSYDLIQVYFQQYGGPNDIVIADLGSGEVKQVHTDRRPKPFNFHLAPTVLGPDGRLYISTLAGGSYQMLVIYDPAKNELLLDAAPLPRTLLGETHPMILGPDGMIYMAGGHPSGSVTAVQVNPKTLEVKDYGPIGPSHGGNGVWAGSIAADDRYLYLSSGRIPFYLVAYDRQTGKSAVLLETEPVGGSVGVNQRPGGVSAMVAGIKGQAPGPRQSFWLQHGQAVPATDPKTPPWPVPATTPVKRAPAPETSDVGLEPDNDGHAALWYRTAAAKAAAPKDAPKDEVSERTGWQALRYQVPVYPMNPYRLVELPDGRLLGTAGAYQGNFVIDPASGEGRHLGKIHLSHYATVIHDGKVYLSGYPSSPVYVYDPAQPWTSGTVVNGRIVEDDDKLANPRRMGYMRDAGTHKMYGAAAGADGRVYFGGEWVRNGSAGGLGWYDTQTEQIGGMWEPFSNYQIGYMTAAENGKTVVISTQRVEDPLLGKPKPAEGALFFFDTVKHELSQPLVVVERAKGPGVVAASGRYVVGWTETPKPAEAKEAAQTSELYGVDAVTRRVVWRITVPVPLPYRIGSNQTENWDFRLGPDGQVWTFMGGALVRIAPRTGVITPVGKVDGGRIAFSGQDVWLAGGGGLQKVAGVIAE